jgi:type II secretory pathway predicted ATPase ExeA
MSYLQYWKLASAPFESNSAGFFSGGSIEEAIARVTFLVTSRRRLGVLMGPTSVGKTLLLRNLRQPIASASASIRPQIVYQSLLGLNTREFFLSLARKLGEGLVGSGNSSRFDASEQSVDDAWSRIQDVLLASVAARNHFVLLLDDVSLANPATLAGIHRILEANSPISCVLAVNSESLDLLPNSLQERCQLRIDLPAWDLGQTADYFDFAIGKSKGRPGLFEAQAITRIHELADGLPQRINRLAELTLVAGASKRIPRITSELTDQVFEEFSLLQTNYLQNATT